MPKAKARKRGKQSQPSSKKQTDWSAIRAEWDANQLSLAVIADAHGITAPAISMRASREGWPKRGEGTPPPTVKSIERAVEEQKPTEVYVIPPEHVNGPLMPFYRALQVLLHHRKQARRLAVMIDTLLDQIDARYRIAEERKRALRLDELKTLSAMQIQLVAAQEKLVKIERRAFGIQDSEAPSEVDTMNEGQLQRVFEVIKAALEDAA